MTANEWFKQASGQQARILRRLRQLVLERNRKITESIKWGRPCYTANSLFCYLHCAKAHVTIGFHQGTALRDPGALLEGTGKGMRHVKLRMLADLDEAAISALIQEALEIDARQPAKA
jgi:hypothetical protein